ncbi:MAG: nucleotidyltransferase family protein [Pleurocapsa sp. SU_196_0]|nr:nucleotidyltransferase family protein [Pleurocapsa sp. SU_196_0]
MTALEAYLLGKREPSLELLRAARLEGWGYAHLPEGHALRSALRPAFLASVGRHALIKNHLVKLLEAWNAAGIEALLVKGFALAEFAYSSPGQRFYGDVDILVRPERARDATRIAKELGWLEVWNRDEAFQEYSHEFSHLFSSDRAARIDLHLEFLQAAHPHERRLELVRTLWESSSHATLGGVPVRVLMPLDALLLMLLNRRWGDWWSRKPSDYPDASVLQTRGGFSRDDLLRRARDLGCEGTITLALESCDPWLENLVLETPRRSERWKRDYAVRHELGFTRWIITGVVALEASARSGYRADAARVAARSSAHSSSTTARDARVGVRGLPCRQCQTVHPHEGFHRARGALVSVAVRTSSQPVRAALPGLVGIAVQSWVRRSVPQRRATQRRGYRGSRVGGSGRFPTGDFQ